MRVDASQGHITCNKVKECSGGYFCQMNIINSTSVSYITTSAVMHPYGSLLSRVELLLKHITGYNYDQSFTGNTWSNIKYTFFSFPSRSPSQLFYMITRMSNLLILVTFCLKASIRSAARSVPSRLLSRTIEFIQSKCGNPKVA